MSLKEDFDSAVIRSKELTERPSNEDLLKLYANFKQATEGDVTGERPGGFHFKGAVKFDACSELKGTTSEKAMEDYIATVKRLHGE